MSRNAKLAYMIMYILKKKGKKPQENEQKNKTNQSKPNQTKLKKTQIMNHWLKGSTGI